MPKLPDFKTDDEFFEFVETHDTANYWDEFESVSDVKIKRPNKKAITIRLYPYLIAETKKVAAQLGMPYQTLIGQWLAERLSQEKQKQAKMIS
jgi:predicted DNA binding CopG/RHH family protein